RGMLPPFTSKKGDRRHRVRSAGARMHERSGVVSRPASIQASCPYQLGAPIDLPELLALPPDGRSYVRDDQGRLAVMSPDPWDKHGTPLVVLTRLLTRRLAEPYWVLPERAIALPRILDLKGRVLRESFLGPKAIEPDIACFSRRPDSLYGPHGLAFVA